MRLLDTNVILYAAGRNHRYKEPCERILKEVAEEGTLYAIDTQLLQEVVYVYASRGERARGLATFDHLLALFPNPFSVSREEMAMARTLLGLVSALSPRDAIHAAVVQTQMLEGIISSDRAFREIPGLAVFDPLDVASTR